MSSESDAGPMVATILVRRGTEEPYRPPWQTAVVSGDDDLVTSRGLHVPSRALRWWASRSGGPGGQHANTSDTHVTVELDLAESDLPESVTQRLRDEHGDAVRASSADSRSQYRNRQLARKRLADLIDGAARPVARRRPTAPSRGAKRRRLEAKRQQGEKKRRRSWRPDAER
jgi:ribosome-associated protein